MKDNLTIWYREYNLDQLNKLGKNTVSEQLGIEFTEIGTDFLVATMPVDNRTIQPFGLLHGGSSVVLAETLGSVASLMAINDDLFMGVGLEINANHLAPVTSGLVTGVCKPIKTGGKVHVWEIKIYRNDGQMNCISRLTTTIVPKRIK